MPIFACNASGRPLSDLDGHSPNCCHLRSSIGCRHQDVRPSATPCTWRTEDRTRSIRAGRCILTMFSGLCRHLCWFSLTFAVEDIDRLDRLGSVRGGLVLHGCDRWGRGGWSLLISFLVWCHRERDRRRFVRKRYRSIPFPEVRPGLPGLRGGSRRGYSVLDPVYRSTILVWIPWVCVQPRTEVLSVRNPGMSADLGSSALPNPVGHQSTARMFCQRRRFLDAFRPLVRVTHCQSSSLSTEVKPYYVTTPIFYPNAGAPSLHSPSSVSY